MTVEFRVLTRLWRARSFVSVCLLAGLLAGVSGCQKLGLKPFGFKDLTLRSQSPDKDDDDDDLEDEFATKLEIPMVGDYTTFTGLHRVVLEGVGLVIGLNGTG